MANHSPGGAQRGRHSLWRNLLVAESIAIVAILAIFSTDYSPAVWVGVVIVALTMPRVVIGYLRSR